VAASRSVRREGRVGWEERGEGSDGGFGEEVRRGGIW